MLKVEQEVNPEVFYRAEAFHIAAKILIDCNQLKFKGGPFIVNSALSIELYLKSMLSCKCFDNLEDGIYGSVYSKVNYGHDLATLFTQIPNNYQKELNIRCRKASTPINISEFFDEYKDCFIKWRYSFEGGAQSYKPNEVLIVMDVLNQLGKDNLT